MYLSRIRLLNWRSYKDAIFEFKKPDIHKPLVLIGAMNGNGKTSLLISLYIGLFGRFGLNYCEGFDIFKKEEEKIPSYKKAISLFRRNSADPDEPTSIEMSFSPTLQDTNEEEIRLIRRWFFSSSNQPKQGDSFETVELYYNFNPIRINDLDSAHDRLERYLFPANIMPAFFFDGEQAQKLINNSGEQGIKKAVEVLFGTRVIEAVNEQIQQYLYVCNQRMGGKRNSSQKEKELIDKCKEREMINERIAHLQKQQIEIEKEKEQLDLNRKEAQNKLAMLGGEKAINIKQIQEDLIHAENEKNNAERSITDTSRIIGLSFALSRLATPVLNRLNSEEIRETWELLREGTLGNADRVLAVAMPEPASNDELLGFLSYEIREKVKERFRSALAQIYNPPPSGCAKEYLFGHVKGELRQTVIENIKNIRLLSSSDIKQRAKRLKETRDHYEDAKMRSERFTNLPHEVEQLLNNINSITPQIQEAIRKLTTIENEIKKLKGDLRSLNADIGRLQEDIAKMEPEQKRVAIAERIHRVADDLNEKLKPITLRLIEDFVTKHFLSIADKRFQDGRITFPSSEDGAPCFEWKSDNPPQRIDTMSGFERRAFGIAFSLALAEITQMRVPLVIDTPLGNADSEYRPRLLNSLKNVNLDQIIILTHDQEVNGSLLENIESCVSQKFLIEFDHSTKSSQVYPNLYFMG